MNKLENLSESLSQFRLLSSKFIIDLLTGNLDPQSVNNYDLYDNLFKIRHDSIHWLICQHRGIPFGEKHIYEIPQLENLRTHKFWNEIKQQSPDIILINNSHVSITEITISQSRLAEKSKMTKYALLTNVIEQSGFTTNLEIIVISTILSIPDRENLKYEFKFNDELIDNIYQVINNVNLTIQQIESTPLGQEWNMRRSGDLFHDVDLGITDQMIIDYHQSSPTKAFNSISELKNFLAVTNYIDPSELSDDDTKFIDTIVEKACTFKSTLDRSENFEDAIKRLHTHHSGPQTTDIKRSFLPLPYLHKMNVDSSIRSTIDDETLEIKIKAAMKDSGDQVLSKIGYMVKTQEKIHFTEADKMLIALEGPGRKKYVKQGRTEFIEAQNIMKSYWFNMETPGFENELNDLLIFFSQREGKNVIDLENFSNSGLDYVKCCQSVFREININAMRKNRRHEYIFKPSGVDGVFLVLYPGPKLRTGENVSQIWFKLVTTREFIDISRWTHHWAFKSWKVNNNVYHTKWLSTDANRLDHYLRAYDKILMSYLSYQHYGPGHLVDNIILDTSDTLGTIIAIYMEDKRSTSKMLQDVRYLVMGSLSMFRYWDSCLSKYLDPIRTPLQALLLRRIIYYSEKITNDPKIVLDDLKFGRVHHDTSFDDISERLSGASILIPRILTTGQNINFQQALCEMYFTMLFNKNQDDPTHSSFQILGKILEGENSLHDIKDKKQRLHIGGLDQFGDLDDLIDTPHKNEFSKYAIMIGSKLQSKSVYNRSPCGLSHRKAAQHKYLNKTLDNYATYKSSSTTENTTFNTRVYAGFKKKDKHGNIEMKQETKLEEEFLFDNPDDITFDEGRQNPRIRCVEGIINLLKMGKMTAFDVISDSILSDLYFQVFKKNQIGGVREILILPIEKRITINILESFSRLICKEDGREMLTHGDIKFSLMRDMIRELKRGPERRIILNYNLDKTRWGPSFMPIQFIYMFKPFQQYYPSLFRFILLTLMCHSNKKCLFPEKLIKAWIKDPFNEYKHNDNNLQNLKEKFLQDKKLYFNNESNMGQGILHYTSSYLHLCAISFRDEVYKRMCVKFNVKPGDWRDIISSDDSYTAQSLPLDTKENVKVRIRLFIRSQEITERVFNIWTSKSKSSISLLVSEFNSMFGSNLTTYPTLFKFALASVNPVNTDSFFRMVKESYNTSRQLLENGGSMELYYISHALNKKYCESIYHTYPGGVNDPEKLGVRRNNVPYHLGIYPIGDPGIMVMLGPEFHNYSILSRSGELNEKERNLMNSAHTVIKVNHPEVYAELTSFDNLFVGLLRIEAAVGPIRKLSSIRRQIDMSWEEMMKYIESNVLLLFREPKTMEECKIKTYLKLFQYGSAEALRTTAASIYYARVSATVSASVFQIPYTEYKAEYNKKDKIMIGHTYLDCLSHLINTQFPMVDYDLFYPHKREYTDLIKLIHSALNYKQRNILETQNLRSLQLNEVTIKIKNPINDLLTHFWSDELPHDDHPTSMIRDWINLKQIIPIIGDSITETLENLSGDTGTRLRSLILLLLRLMGYSSKPMKAVVYGPSSRAYDQTYLTLLQLNMYHNLSNEELILNQTIESKPRIFDKLYYTYDLFVLSIKSGNPIDVIKYIDVEDAELYCRDQYTSSTSKKKIMIMFMYSGILDDVDTWTFQTKQILHEWLIRQKMIHNQYVGKFILKLQCGSTIMILEGFNSRINITINSTSNSSLLYDMLKEASFLIQSSLDMVLTKMDKGSFIVMGDKIIPSSMSTGVYIHVQELDKIKYYPGNVIIQDDMLVLLDNLNYQIMKTPLGLLATDYIPLDNEFEEIIINGILISSLSKIRAFSQNFSFDHVNVNQLFGIVHDLEVPRPAISHITKMRLKGLVADNWDEKTFSDELLNVEEGKMQSEEIKLNPIDPYDSLIDVDLPADFGEFIGLWNLNEDPLYDDYLDPSLDFGLISSLKTTRVTFHPMVLWERILNFKYNAISRMCIDIRTLNRNSIKAIYRQTRNKHLSYCLVYMYDKMYTNTDVPSPPNMDVHMSNDFINKFNLLDDLDEELQ